MKDLKIPIGWLVPIIGVILLLGWFLGRSGWNMTEVDTGIAKLAPPTATNVSHPLPQSTTAPQPAISTTSSSTASLVNRILLGSDVPLASLVKEILQNPSQVSQTQLENAVWRIQAEADRLHSGRFESNSIDIPQDNWWLVWCSNVPSKYYNGLPAG